MQEQVHNKPLTYQDILDWDPLIFLEYLDSFKTEVNCCVETPEEMSLAGRELGRLANLYSFLTSLYAYAGVRKRQIARKEKGDAYQEMIDKERAVEQALKAVDLQYRAVNKAITVHVENMKELNMTKAMP